MIWLLDNGHGGIVNGQYCTPGKRSPVWGDLPQLYEGVFNRELVYLLATELKRKGFLYEVVVHEQLDIDLVERVRRVNAYARAGAQCVLLSMHGNAGGGTGWEVFTSKGETQSDKLVPYFFTEFSLAFQGERMRTDYSDGDPDKESDFYVLKNTVCPALLFENFFMDTRHDCQLMLSASGKLKMVKAYAKAIERIENIRAKGLGTF